MISAILLLFAGLARALSAHTEAGDGEQFIIGGKDTNITEVPYIVVILYGDRFTCGGSILSEKYILTAAHCIKKSSLDQLQVRVGSSYAHKGGVLHKVRRAVSHPSYKPRTHDIAIIELEEPLKFSETAQPIALTNVEPKGGERAFVAGYGRNGTKTLPEQLQSLHTLTLSRKDCAAYGPITPQVMCFYSPGTSAWKGDSGGPIVINGKLVGACSFLYKSPFNSPTFFANIAQHELREFIRQESGI